MTVPRVSDRTFAVVTVVAVLIGVLCLLGAVLWWATTPILPAPTDSPPSFGPMPAATTAPTPIAPAHLRQVPLIRTAPTDVAPMIPMCHREAR